MYYIKVIFSSFNCNIIFFFSKSNSR